MERKRGGRWRGREKGDGEKERREMERKRGGRWRGREEGDGEEERREMERVEQQRGVKMEGR